MALKVGIDVSSMHAFSSSRGIGVYAKNLLDAINRYTDTKALLIEKEGEKEDVGLIHYPYFDFFTSTLPVIKRKPTVVTIHDCIPLLFPTHYPPGIKGKVRSALQLYSLKSVSQVITVSKSSKNDIENICKIPSEKIFVVPSAPPPSFEKITDEKRLQKSKAKYNLPDTFALYIGGVNWNKNLLNMAQSCILSNTPLVLIGGSFNERENLNHPELASFKLFLEGFSDNPKISILGYVPEEDLVSITNLAFCTLLPSFYEGFGFPILQSQLCGVPVITSDVSSMPEVAGKGALFIDPNDIESIKSAILKLKNIKTREEVVKNGYENCAHYSWEQTAKLTTHVYKQTLKTSMESL